MADTTQSQSKNGRDEHGRFVNDSEEARSMGRKGGKQRAENQKNGSQRDRDQEDEEDR